MDVSTIFIDIKKSLSIAHCFIKCSAVLDRSLKLSISESCIKLSSGNNVTEKKIHSEALKFIPNSCNSIEASFNNSNEYLISFKVDVFLSGSLLEINEDSDNIAACETAALNCAACAFCCNPLIDFSKFTNVIKEPSNESLDISESIWCPCRHHIHNNHDQKDHDCKLNHNQNDHDCKLNHNQNDHDCKLNHNQNDHDCKLNHNQNDHDCNLKTAHSKIIQTSQANHPIRNHSVNVDHTNTLKNNINHNNTNHNHINDCNESTDKCNFKENISGSKTNILNIIHTDNSQMTGKESLKSIESNESIKKVTDRIKTLISKEKDDVFNSLSVGEQRIQVDYRCIDASCQIDKEGVLTCRRCGHYLGNTVLGDAKNYNSAIERTRVNMNNRKNNLYLTLKEKYLTLDCSRFVVESFDENNKRIQILLLWLMDVNSSYYLLNEKTSVDEISLEAKHAIKVLYCFSSHGSNKILTRSWLYDFSVECLTLDLSTAFKTAKKLSESTLAIPRHLRKTNEFFIGYIEQDSL